MATRARTKTVTLSKDNLDGIEEAADLLDGGASPDDDDTPAGDDHTTLTPFDGRTVATASIAVTNAGDGLSKAMAIAPREFALDDTVFVLIECKVSKIAYSEVKDTDLLNRVHTLRAEVGTIVDENFAGKTIAAQKRAIERANGIIPLFDDSIAEDE